MDDFNIARKSILFFVNISLLKGMFLTYEMTLTNLIALV